MCESRLDRGGGGGRVGGKEKEKERGKCRMIKQIGEIKNKCIYNDKNAYLSIPLLVMSTRCMNLCREGEEKKNGEKMTIIRQRKILFEQSSKSQMNNINNKKFI